MKTSTFCRGSEGLGGMAKCCHQHRHRVGARARLNVNRIMTNETQRQSLCRPVQLLGSLVYGPPTVITQRIQMEEAFLNATVADLNPAGITNRWTNYTAHPSQTPGACP